MLLACSPQGLQELLEPRVSRRQVKPQVQPPELRDVVPLAWPLALVSSQRMQPAVRPRRVPEKQQE